MDMEPNRMNIYTVTTIQHEAKRYREDGSHWMWRDSRTVGYLYDFAEAEKLLTSNAMDLNEAGYYPLAIIECIPEGIYPFQDPYEMFWYEWDKKKEKYVKRNTPEEYECTIGFAMG